MLTKLTSYYHNDIPPHWVKRTDASVIMNLHIQYLYGCTMII